MTQSADHFLQDALSDTELSDEVVFVHPDDPATPQEEAALRAFLQAFEAELAGEDELKPGSP